MGLLSVIDFGPQAKKESINNYFYQCTAYCVMFEELTGACGCFVVVIGVDQGTTDLYGKKMITLQD